VIKYITVEDTVNLNTAGGVSVDTNVFIHSGLNIDSIYMYYAFIRDGSGHFSRFSELKSAKPLNMSIATIIADIGFNADTVELTGDFNNYSMTKLSDGRWGAAISAASYVEYEYKLRVNGSIMEEDAEYEFLYYDTTHLADSIFLRGVFNSWELQDSYMLRKIDGTDTWGIWLTGITDGMQYKYYINGEWEPDPNRSAANSTNGANRKIYLTTPDTFEIDWSGRANPPAFDVQPVSSDSIIIYFSSQSNSDFYDSFYWKIYRSFERDSGYELKYSASAFDSYFIDSGLEPFTTYYYRISGADSGVSAENMKEGNLSVSDSATTLSEFLINFSVSGIIDRQGSPNDSGVVVRISNGVETQSAITSETGYYSLTVHSADTYVFLFYKTGYKNESFEKYINSDTAIQAINLIAGDFYKDGVFGAKDAALLRKYYGKTNPEIDINDDNLVGTEEKNYLKLNYSK
nr:hypothetical protein [bacterium]